MAAFHRLIKVKILTKCKPDQDGVGWMGYFPEGEKLRWAGCEFTFDRYCRDYDWLVVYDDLPSVSGERATLWEEPLACAVNNTLLIVSEPSSVKTYGRAFTRQFHWVLSTQESWALAHPRVIRRQPGLTWFYTTDYSRGLIDRLRGTAPINKTSFFSTVCSAKRHGHTLHRKRYDFVQGLKRVLPDLEVFGRGVRPIMDKREALDPFRYHLAIENHVSPHHWTEKLADAFLGACLPIYYGCAEIAQYFPEESFIALPALSDPLALADIALAAERDRLWEKRLPFILEARRRVLDQYGPIAQMAELIMARHQLQSHPATVVNSSAHIASRHSLRRRSCWSGMAFGLEKTLVQLRVRLAS